MSEITELQEVIRARNICPWCLVAVWKDGKGGMAPFLLRGVYFHKGCLADQYRTELELQPGEPLKNLVELEVGRVLAHQEEDNL